MSNAAPLDLSEHAEAVEADFIDAVANDRPVPPAQDGDPRYFRETPSRYVTQDGEMTPDGFMAHPPLPMKEV